MKKNIGFVGAGRMATAMAAGILARGFAAKEEINAFDPSLTAAKAFIAATDAEVMASIDSLLQWADVLVLAVKPQNLAAATAPIAGKAADKLIISIVAGATTAKLENLLGTARVIRVMPNTPALIGEGVSAYCLGGGLAKGDEEFCRQVLEAVGATIKVDESMMDAVTGLGGSGPAYVFEFIYGLIEGGVHEGLPFETARALAARTVAGAAKMLLDNDIHPMTLRDQVVSPGGTTSRGLAELKSSGGGLKDCAARAVVAATRRSRELGTE